MARTPALVLLLCILLCSNVARTASTSAFAWDPKSESMFARLMCADGEYFRECFASSKSVCEQAMKQESRICDRGIAPKTRKKLVSEVQLFAEIGVCVGVTIEKKWRDRKASMTKCDSKENWQ